MSDIRIFLDRAINHIEHKLYQLAINDIKDALDTLQNDKQEVNATTIQYYNLVKAILEEKYGAEGYDAFCMGTFLILKSKGYAYDISEFLKESLCDS